MMKIFVCRNNINLLYKISDVPHFNTGFMFIYLLKIKFACGLWHNTLKNAIVA